MALMAWWRAMIGISKGTMYVEKGVSNEYTLPDLLCFVKSRLSSHLSIHSPDFLIF